MTHPGTPANPAVAHVNILPTSGARRPSRVPERKVQRVAPNPDQLVWRDVLAYLKRHHPDMCRQWFEDLEPLGPNEGVFRVRVHQPVHLRYLAKQCADRFTEALQAVTARLLPVRFVGDGEGDVETVTPFVATGAESAAAATPASAAIEAGALPTVGPVPAFGGQASAGPNAAESKPAPAPVPVRSGATPAAPLGRFESVVINPDYTFENFIVGPENRLAHAASLAVAGKPGKIYNPLFIHGGVGLGKTHLLQAMHLKLMRECPGIRIHYTSCEAFMNQYLEAVRAGEAAEFRHRYREADVLFVDDIHFLTKRDTGQEEFFHTFNELYQSGKQIVLSSDAAPGDIPDLEQRLVSRFQCGLVVQVNPPCYDTRVQIIKQKSRIREIEMPDDAACFIAGRSVANIRELEGAITKVQVQAMADRAPITLELAKIALGPGTPTGGSRPEVTITGIIDVVIEHYDVKLSDLQSKRRQKSIAHPRQVCMFLARRLTRYSLEEIGGYFGGRDHTTVMHAVRTIEERRDADAEFARVLQGMEARLGAVGSSGAAARE